MPRRSPRWTTSGGQEGEAPTGARSKEMLDLFDKAKGVPAEERIKLAKEVFSLLCDNVFVMGTVGQSPALMGVWVVSNDLGNVPMEVPFSSLRHRLRATPCPSSGISRNRERTCLPSKS